MYFILISHQKNKMFEIGIFLNFMIGFFLVVMCVTYRFDLFVSLYEILRVYKIKPENKNNKIMICSSFL